MSAGMSKSIVFPILVSGTLLVACFDTAPDGDESETSSSVPSEAPPVFGSGAPAAPAYNTHCSPAPALHTNAVCLCDSMTHAGRLVTEAKPGEAADVAINGGYRASTNTDIAGSLRMKEALTMAGNAKVRDHVLAAGDLTGVGSLRCGGDLAVGGTMTAVADIEVGATLRTNVEPTVVGTLKSAARASYVAPTSDPCDCDPKTFYDVKLAVQTAATSNDNAAAGLATDQTLLQKPLVLTRGRYYFERIITLDSNIRVEGDVQLYINSSLTQVGSNTIELAPGAKLDLFINGSLSSAGDFVAGDIARPDAFHLYVTDAVTFAGDRDFNGTVYAPTASVSFAGKATVRGALTAREVTFADTLLVQYGKPVSQGKTCEEGEAPKAVPPR
jgi:hypothetical protein